MANKVELPEKIDKDLEKQKEWRILFLVVKHECTHPLSFAHTHNIVGFLKVHQPNGRKEERKWFPNWQQQKAIFPGEPIFYSQKSIGRRRMEIKCFFQFSRKGIEIFYGFFENHAGGRERLTFLLFATSIFVSLIHAILGNNCDIETKKSAKKRASCVLFIIPATTALWRHASSTLCFSI